MSGELTFDSPSQAALWNVLGSALVSCTRWAGKHVARVSRTVGRGQEGSRLSKATHDLGKDEGQRGLPLRHGEHCCVSCCK